MAKSKAQNERLVRVGPGTPMGELMRRYWQPVAVTAMFDENPVRKIRLLGEDLALFRTERGKYGLIDDRCPHRCMSLEFGIPEECGLRCAYHGWLFDPQGQCLEQPFESGASGVDVQERDQNQGLSGRGARRAWSWPISVPHPRRCLPRWDVLLRDDLDRAIEILKLPCNWLQCMDNRPIRCISNSFTAVRQLSAKRLGRPPAINPGSARQDRVRRVQIRNQQAPPVRRRARKPRTNGRSAIRCSSRKHPCRRGGHNAPMLQYRVPIDDTHTVQFTYSTGLRKAGEAVKPITVQYEIYFDENGKVIVPIDTILKQDMVAWVGQGPISDRVNEHLSTGDKGLILYHRLLNENMDRVARGEDPLGTIRDAAKNEPMIEIRRGHDGYKSFAVRDELSSGAVWASPVKAAS